MVACHLRKAVDWWQDMGYGEYGLYYLRTKDKREVDFLVTRNQKPWFMVEVKSSKRRISPNLSYFHTRLKTGYAFQLIMDADFTDVDCFNFDYPIQVPGRTLLSQLI